MPDYSLVRCGKCGKSVLWKRSVRGEHRGWDIIDRPSSGDESCRHASQGEKVFLEWAEGEIGIEDEQIERREMVVLL